MNTEANRASELLLTRHGCVDSTYVCEEGDLGELDRESWCLDHFVLEDLGALGGVVKRIDVEVTKIDNGLVGREVVDEGLCTIGEDVVEEVILEVLSAQRLGVGALDGERLPAQVLRAVGRVSERSGEGQRGWRLTEC